MALRHPRRLRGPAVVLVATIALPEPAASSPTGRGVPRTGDERILRADP